MASTSSRFFWKIVVSYDGTAFHGWQVQPGLSTVQGALAAVLKRLTGETVLPQGSGRTDAGVHALGQVVGFSLCAPLPAQNLLRAMNRLLPGSIRVLHIDPVDESFHARHSALRKSYEYRIFERRSHHSTQERICSPFLAPYVWDCRWPLDLSPISQAAATLCGTHNFTSFAATDPELPLREQDAYGTALGPNPIKTIHQSYVLRQDALLLYRVTGTGFLHHMIRNIVGTLVEIGRGSMPAERMTQILHAQNRTLAGPTAPAHGLFLVSVDYGETTGLGSPEHEKEHPLAPENSREPFRTVLNPGEQP
ncbi:MAG: tRNA pseudouridine(38-40) synthase TruA [Acidobacteriaceae bacterium]